MLRFRDAYRIQALTDDSEKSQAFYHAQGFVASEQVGERTMVPTARPKAAPQTDIRPMNKEEIEGCVSVIRASFMTVAQEFGITEQNAPRFTAFATNAQRLQWQYAQGRPMFLCVNEEGLPIGYYSLCEKSREEVELNNLCVLPACRRRKLGEALLLHALREAMVRGYQYMTIGIVEENKQLRMWYEKYGFVHTGTEKFAFFPFTCGYMKKQLFSEE